MLSAALCSATGALQLVGEMFPWGPASQFAYTRCNHKSVLGESHTAGRKQGKRGLQAPPRAAPGTESSPAAPASHPLTPGQAFGSMPRGTAHP